MALNPGAQGQAYQSALAAIRHHGTGADLGAIARELQGRFGLTTSEPYITFLNLVMAADRNWRQASESDLFAVDRLRDIPIDPTITRGSGLIQYRVVVVTTDEFGNKAENLVSILSPVPISLNDAKTLAEAQVSSGQQVRTTNPRRDVRGSQLSYSSVVVSVGRAGN